MDERDKLFVYPTHRSVKRWPVIASWILLIIIWFVLVSVDVQVEDNAVAKFAPDYHQSKMER